MKKSAILLAAIALLSPSIASAHPGHGSSVVEGFLHPLTGIDHLCALIALGIFASRLPNRRALAVVAGFLACFAAGFVAVRLGLVLPAQEPVLAVSLLGMGALATVGHRVSFTLACATAGFFAAYHGGAHGSELGSLAPIGAVLGFVLACFVVTGSAYAVGRLKLSASPQVSTRRRTVSA